MRNLLSLSFPLVAAAVLFSPSTSRAEVIYADDFGGGTGEKLAGRQPETATKPGASYDGNTQLVLNGAGQVVSTNGSGAVSLPLPEIKPGDVISLTAKVRAAGEPVTWIGVGFTESPETLSSFGQMTAAVRADGAARVFTGPQKSGNLLYREASNVAKSDGATTAPVILSLTFNTGNFKLQAKVDDKVIYDGPIDYTTCDRLRYATFELARQNSSETSDPGLVENFKVELVRP